MTAFRLLPGQRDEGLIVLLNPLPLEEIVVAAAFELGVFVTDGRPGVVDRAAAGLGIEEHADAAVDLVFLMPENLFAFRGFREALAGHFDVDVEMLRQAIEIALVDDDPVVAAAIRRAFRTVVRSHQMECTGSKRWRQQVTEATDVSRPFNLHASAIAFRGAYRLQRVDEQLNPFLPPNRGFHRIHQKVIREYADLAGGFQQ